MNSHPPASAIGRRLRLPRDRQRAAGELAEFYGHCFGPWTITGNGPDVEPAADLVRLGRATMRPSVLRGERVYVIQLRGERGRA